MNTSNNCISIDPSALALGEDGKPGVPPRTGDAVEFTAAGKVKSISGGVAQIEIQAINGQPLQPPAEEAGEAAPGAEELAGIESALRAKAADSDAQGGY